MIENCDRQQSGMRLLSVIRSVLQIPYGSVKCAVVLCRTKILRGHFVPHKNSVRPFCAAQKKLCGTKKRIVPHKNFVRPFCAAQKFPTVVLCRTFDILIMTGIDGFYVSRGIYAQKDVAYIGSLLGLIDMFAFAQGYGMFLKMLQSKS